MRVHRQLTDFSGRRLRRSRGPDVGNHRSGQRRGRFNGVGGGRDDFNVFFYRRYQRRPARDTGLRRDRHGPTVNNAGVFQVTLTASKPFMAPPASIGSRCRARIGFRRRKPGQWALDPLRTLQAGFGPSRLAESRWRVWYSHEHPAPACPVGS